MAEAELQPAPPGAERYAKDRVGPEWRSLSQEEWIARHIHTFPLWGWADYTFADAEFNAWIRGVEAMLRELGPDGIEALQRKYLTATEYAAAEEIWRDPF